VDKLEIVKHQRNEGVFAALYATVAAAEKIGLIF
jgi:hypothetical protein